MFVDSCIQTPIECVFCLENDG